MKKQEIFDLMARFESSSLTALEIEEDGTKVRFERNLVAAPNNTSGLQSGAETISSAKIPQRSDSFVDCTEVRSPIVGVFYRASAPEEKPFVTEGQHVDKGQTLCMVEAMKMMNELTSPVDGIVGKILTSDGDMVEYDQVLFEVKPC